MKLVLSVNALTAEDVTSELSRRLHIGFIFEDNYYQADDASQAAISIQAISATIAIMENRGDDGNYRWQDEAKDFQYITSNNKKIKMDAPTVTRLNQTCASYRSRLKLAARDIKDRLLKGEKITNVQDDSLWK